MSFSQYPIRAIMVSVDYSDFLGLTLPYNRHHFESVYVVTSSADALSQEVARQFDCVPIVTDLFYESGAVFNKWKALEYGLDVMGRSGWITIMDADILWPKYIPRFDLQFGTLYGPRRHMFEDLSQNLPMESHWPMIPLHRNEEYAGWTQIFHADDPHLGPAPWHEVNWKHAGGADSFFHMKWPDRCKARPPFNVLHLGQAGTNWCGRVTPFLNGTRPSEAGDRHKRLMDFMRQRRVTKSFDSEKY